MMYFGTVLKSKVDHKYYVVLYHGAQWVVMVHIRFNEGLNKPYQVEMNDEAVVKVVEMENDFMVTGLYFDDFFHVLNEQKNERKTGKTLDELMAEGDVPVEREDASLPQPPEEESKLYRGISSKIRKRLR